MLLIKIKVSLLWLEIVLLGLEHVQVDWSESVNDPNKKQIFVQ